VKVKRSKKTAFTTISIPTQLFRKVEKHVEDTGFPSVSSYVAFILRNIIGERKGEIGDAETKAIREKLKNLGYL
jgi:Arc/MetJ-type ribon-helix-helix transcriptional regulator